MNLDPETLKAISHVINLLMVFAMGVGGWFLRELRQRFDRIEGRIDQDRQDRKEIEKKVEQNREAIALLRAELPRDFVMRDDFLRITATLERKLDGLSLDVRALIGQMGERNACPVSNLAGRNAADALPQPPVSGRG